MGLLLLLFFLALHLYSILIPWFLEQALQSRQNDW